MAPQTWYDSIFAHLYRYNNRYLVEVIFLLLAAITIHIGYGVLSDRQREYSSSTNGSSSSPSSAISIGTITNSGQGSSTQINQEGQKPK